MSLTSKTGLVASPTKKIAKFERVAPVQLKAIARPAPFVLKPFAGLYNPYPYGCSLLCNHPTDNEARELLKKAKNTWAVEGRNLLLSEEIAAIRSEMEQLQLKSAREQQAQLEAVPEELFRRYTETDSRPLTPAPTLASAATRASGSRRCLTPDPIITNNVREKTLLILDLRRSHSQETLSWHGSALLQEPPIIKIEKVSPRRAKFELLKPCKSPTPKSPRRKISHAPDLDPVFNQTQTEEQEPQEGTSASNEAEDTEMVRRRGKKRRKRGRESSGGPAGPVLATLDPETQVATIGGDESRGASGRASLVPGSSIDVAVGDIVEETRRGLEAQGGQSYLDKAILRQLRRELDTEVIENEFNYKRRLALEEALKMAPKEKNRNEALIKLQKELNLPPINTDLWLKLPRVFTRSSARFELPLDSRTLQNMTPLEYARDNVSIISSRKLLYNCIFNKFKEESDLQDEDGDRQILGENMLAALDLMMGTPLKERDKAEFELAMGWSRSALYDFRTFCGICAVCERLLAVKCCPKLLSRQEDPCHEIEMADFESLQRKLFGLEINRELLRLLNDLNTA